MNILITGATGLVGKKLVATLRKEHHVVHYLTTSKSKLLEKKNYKGFYWNPISGEIDTAAFQDVEVIIHLAGASISKKWTKSYKKEIFESRINGANLIFNTLNQIPHTVKRFVSASAIGIYPNDLHQVYSETNSSIDDSFLGEVTQAWEMSAHQFKNLNIAVTIVRIGVVLAKESGALVEMAKPIRYGFGSALGTGNQFVSWIHIDDLVALFKYVLDKNLHGIYNAVSPYPVTNKELTVAIAKTLHKPLFLPKVPVIVLKLMLGEMHIIIVNGQCVSCRKILDTGFQFNYASLEKALVNLLQ
ncbi:TIGR01777 family oxidoreductase [Flavobacterium urocaniciphilum]|uniref:TIGR01777 family protein n=1 Tax=Flavobacterium urocaniciphilum TaxID=1299341 RepID=A0A1H8YYQ6_9FLAO|nr:TIGR01777 family oxidoreductase [Flavobacterium urocaniciphilum]SEP56508.1 hypothetical protein SAMN05444005_101308 [Flavobacterium urocaniciphilum]